ncbi:hypothetical protein CAT7_00630 [Carnobacterium sp. AT7]|nr:hypothetical protein CAT7_00630 [Carnobacterium sp. AT7]
MPGIGVQLSDVIIDSYGAGVGMLLQTLFVAFRSNRNKNKVVENS